MMASRKMETGCQSSGQQYLRLQSHYSSRWNSGSDKACRWMGSVIFVSLWLVITACPIFGQISAGLDRFRVDNLVQVEKDDEIIQIKTQTIFSDGLVFDFIGDNGEIIIYHEETGLFTLLNPIHRIQTELTMTEINLFLERIRERLQEKKDKFYQFMVNPEFEVSQKEDGGEFLFQSKWIDYKIKTVPFEQASMAREYYLFSDAYSRLNIYLNPGTTTPFARLQVNKVLQENGLFPEKLDLNVYPKGKWLFGKTIKISSEHIIVRRLSERDQGKIMRGLHFIEQFPQMPFNDYQKAILKR